MFSHALRSGRTRQSSDHQTMVDRSSLFVCFSVEENLFSIFCNRSIRGANDVNECSEAECRMKLFEQNNEENLATKEVFSLNVHLTDHTGTISNVKLGDDVARKLLKCSVREAIRWQTWGSLSIELGRWVSPDDRRREDQIEMELSPREIPIRSSGTSMILSLSFADLCWFVSKIKTNTNYMKPVVRIACLFPREYLSASINEHEWLLSSVQIQEQHEKLQTVNMKQDWSDGYSCLDRHSLQLDRHQQRAQRCSPLKAIVRDVGPVVSSNRVWSIVLRVDFEYEFVRDTFLAWPGDRLNESHSIKETPTANSTDLLIRSKWQASLPVSISNQSLRISYSTGWRILLVEDETELLCATTKEDFTSDRDSRRNSIGRCKSNVPSLSLPTWRVERGVLPRTIGHSIGRRSPNDEDLHRASPREHQRRDCCCCPLFSLTRILLPFRLVQASIGSATIYRTTSEKHRCDQALRDTHITDRRFS